MGLLVAAAVCWSLAGVLIKFVPWPPLAVAGGRGALAAVFLAVSTRPLHFRFSKLNLAAAVAYAACTVTFVAATKLTTAANAIVLQYTAPIYVALLSHWFLREKIRAGDWIALLVVLAGIALFFADELRFENVAGNLVAIASGVCFAAMTLLLRKEKDGSPAGAIIVGNVIAFAIGLPSLLHAPALSGAGWTALGLLGFVQLGLSYWLYTHALPHVTALELVLFPILEPILNPIWTWFAYGERPGHWAFMGAILVLGGVLASAVQSVRRNRPEIDVPLGEA